MRSAYMHIFVSFPYAVCCLSIQQHCMDSHAVHIVPKLELCLMSWLVRCCCNDCLCSTLLWSYYVYLITNHPLHSNDLHLQCVTCDLSKSTPQKLLIVCQGKRALILNHVLKRLYKAKTSKCVHSGPMTMAMLGTVIWQVYDEFAFVPFRPCGMCLAACPARSCQLANLPVNLSI